MLMLRAPENQPRAIADDVVSQASQEQAKEKK
jgi:hypothetical protein